MIASRSAVVSPASTSASAAACRSSNTFCLLAAVAGAGATPRPPRRRRAATPARTRRRPPPRPARTRCRPGSRLIAEAAVAGDQRGPRAASGPRGVTTNIRTVVPSAEVNSRCSVRTVGHGRRRRARPPPARSRRWPGRSGAPAGGVTRSVQPSHSLPGLLRGVPVGDRAARSASRCRAAGRCRAGRRRRRRAARARPPRAGPGPAPAAARPPPGRLQPAHRLQHRARVLGDQLAPVLAARACAGR